MIFRGVVLALVAPLFFGCNPRGLAPAPPPTADVDAHAAALRARVGPGFTVRSEPPFVVVGDLAPAAMQHQSEGTVRWAATLLKRDFFTRDPAEVLEVWLFKDADSYESHTRKLFGIRPTTPYGFYSSEHKALIMNISTGGRDSGARDRSPLRGGQFPRLPGLAQRGVGIAVRAGRRGVRAHSRVHQLASARAAEGHSRGEAWVLGPSFRDR